jgi:hypothetical protein
VSFRVVMMARQIPEGCEGVIKLVSVTISLGMKRMEDWIWRTCFDSGSGPGSRIPLDRRNATA